MDKIINKQLTRKQFLIAGLSLAGLFIISKAPKILSGVKESFTSSNNNHPYGGNTYGGGAKNV